MPTITITEGETASFGGQPWPTQNLDTYFSTALTSGTAQLADFVVHSNGFYFRVNDYIGDPTDGVLAPVIWHFDTVDDELAEGTESAEVNIYYETRATPDSPLVTGTFGPITIVILDNDEAVVEEEPPIEEEPPAEEQIPIEEEPPTEEEPPVLFAPNLYFDLDQNGTRGDIDVAVTGLAEASILLERMLTAETQNIRRFEIYIQELEDDTASLSREVVEGIANFLGKDEPPTIIAPVTYNDNATFVDLVLNVGKEAVEQDLPSNSERVGRILEVGLTALDAAAKTSLINKAVIEIGKGAFTVVTDIWGPSVRVRDILEEIEVQSSRVEESRAQIGRIEEAIAEINAMGGDFQSPRAEAQEGNFFTITSSGQTMTSFGTYFVRDILGDHTGVEDTINDNELLFGTGMSDVFETESSGGFYAVDGEEGMDTLILDQNANAFSVGIASNSFQLGSSGSVIVGRNIERIIFDQETLALDFDGVAGQTYRLYQAAFDRTPDKPGLGFWIENFDVGNVTLSSMAQHFMTSAEFSDSYGAIETLPDESYLDLLYENVLGRSADQAGFDFWSEQQEQGVSREDMLVYFSESVENVGLTSSIVTDGIWF